MADELNGAAPAAAESTSASATETSAPASMPAADAPSAEPAQSFDESLKANAERIWAKHNPPREAGRFAPRNPSEAAPTEAAPDAPVTDQAQQATLEPAKPAIEPPHAWSAEEKALWAKVPPEVQAVMARRETEAHRQITQMGQQFKAIEPVKAIVEQEQDYLRQVGRTPHEAVQQLFAVSHALDRDPASAIGWLARHYGVDLQAIAAGTQQQPSRVQTDPQLVQTVRQLQADMRARQQAEDDQKLRTITHTIETFAKDKPHFQDLEPAIESQVKELQQSHPHLSPSELLAAAYEKANATVDRIVAARLKVEADKRKAEQEKQVKEARRQAPFAQKPGIGNSHVKESFEDTLRRNVQRVMGT